MALVRPCGRPVREIAPSLIAVALHATEPTAPPRLRTRLAAGARASARKVEHHPEFVGLGAVLASLRGVGVRFRR
jgi:hypothetical protein